MKLRGDWPAPPEVEVAPGPPREACRNCKNACEHGWAHGRGCQEGCIESPCFEPTPEARAFGDDLLERIIVICGRKHPNAVPEETDRVRDQIARLFDVHTRKVRYQAQ